MTLVLVVLAVGTVVAGFVGVPPALSGGNRIEHFLEPSFTAHAPAAGLHVTAPGETGALAADSAGRGAHEAEVSSAAAGQHGAEEGEAGMSRAGELGLMGLSVLIGVIGIWVAYRFYVRRPEIAERLAERWSTPHRWLTTICGRAVGRRSSAAP
jgi:NADH-quinone oxidoreductase subunit L